MYRLGPINLNGTSTTVIRLSDMSFIPMDDNNSDYQKYQLWVQAGNTPEAAE